MYLLLFLVVKLAAAGEHRGRGGSALFVVVCRIVSFSSCTK